MLFRRFLFWIRRDKKARNCGILCVTCSYYELCRIDELEGRKRIERGCIMLKLIWYICMWPFYLLGWLCKVICKMICFFLGICVIGSLFD